MENQGSAIKFNAGPSMGDSLDEYNRKIDENGNKENNNILINLNKCMTYSIIYYNTTYLI